MRCNLFVSIQLLRYSLHHRRKRCDFAGCLNCGLFFSLSKTHEKRICIFQIKSRVKYSRRCNFSARIVTETSLKIIRNEAILRKMSVQLDDTADINQKLQCSLCQKWLTVFPIYLDSSKKFVCGRHNPADSYSRSSEFESFVQWFKFPCDYKEYGCKELFNIEKLRKHEMECMYQPISCRYCQSWKGNLMQLDHINDKHRNAILDSPAIIDLGTFLKTSPRLFETYFIKVNNSQSSKLFTVQLKCSKKILKVCIMYNGREPENALYLHQLQFYSADENNALMFPQACVSALNNSDDVFLKPGMYKQINLNFF